MIKIEIKLQSENLLNVFQGLANLDMTPILDDAGAFLLNKIRTRFLAEKDPSETPWIPSKAGIRRRKKGGTGTLFDTGTLFRSIQLGIVGEGYFNGLPASQRIIGTDVPYAPYHQFGTPKLPARPFMGFNDLDVEVMTAILERRLESMFDAAFPQPESGGTP